MVDSYLWFGHAGVLLNSILAGYFLVLAGLLLAKYMHQPLSYVPVLLLVPVLAMPVSIKAFHYVAILRALVGLALFYAIARRLGLVRDNRLRDAFAATDAGGPIAAGAESLTSYRLVRSYASGFDGSASQLR